MCNGYEAYMIALWLKNNQPKQILSEDNQEGITGCKMIIRGI
jgi:hypothetical protein